MSAASASSVARLPEGVMSGECLPGFEHIKRYWDRVHHTVAAKIHPGQYYVTRNQEIIVTVLGSCVSACIRDPKRGIGGMNHFMLPDDASGVGNPLSLATRYGNVAMEHLVNTILKYGGSRENLEVKLFGGGRIISSFTNIGERNIEFVREYVTVEGLRLVAEDLGDIYPRKLIYDPISGRARVKKLRSLHNDTIVRREFEYRHELEHQPVEGEIDLF